MDDRHVAAEFSSWASQPEALGRVVDHLFRFVTHSWFDTNQAYNFVKRREVFSSDIASIHVLMKCSQIVFNYEQRIRSISEYILVKLLYEIDRIICNELIDQAAFRKLAA